MPTTVARSADLGSSQKSRIRILTLDGGGVRGLSSLLILRQVMQRLEVQRACREAIRPCECFDLIIGTGTGGMAQTAFIPAPNKWPSIWKRNSESLLSGADLAHAISNIAERYLGKEDPVTVGDPSQGSSRCHTAVLAIPTANADAPPYVIRSYATRQPASSLTIPEAARATASMAGLFAPVALGNPPAMYGDAALSGYNNPAEIALQEAALLWPGVEIDCVVSIGTGLQKIVPMGNEWTDIIAASKKIIESCELVHDRVFRRFHAGKVPYFRFNVDRGLDGVAITEWTEAGAEGTLTGITESYMRWGAVDVSLDSCVYALNEEAPVEHSMPAALPNDKSGPAVNASPTAAAATASPTAATITASPMQGLSSAIQPKTGTPISSPSPARPVASDAIGNPSIARTYLGNQRIQITLTLKPKNLPESDLSTRVAWEVFNIESGSATPLLSLSAPNLIPSFPEEPIFECEMPSDLGFGGVTKDENKHVHSPFFTFCSRGSSVRVRTRHGNDIWENIGRHNDAEEVIKVINATGHQKPVALGSYHRGTAPRLQPFHLVSALGKGVDYSVSSDLILQAYRTQGCEKGQEIERDKLSDILFEAPIRTLQQVSTWQVRPEGPDGIKLETVINE